MPTEKHWDNLAKSFEGEVGNPLFDDRNQAIIAKIQECSNQLGTAIDFGCGIGSALPLLAAKFARVIAIDISAECLIRAKLIAEENVSFKHRDLTKQISGLSPAHLSYCCNVAILPDIAMNKRIFGNVCRPVQRGGHVIFIIPSVESAILTAMRLADWYQKEGIAYTQIDRKEFVEFNAKNTSPCLGLLSRAGVVTKHYLREEIEVFFQHKQMRIDSISKVEYDWTTEFTKPPSWMKDPYPWDWMVHYRK